MPVHKLSSTDAFVVFDLDNCPSSLGFVRCAPKLLASSSAELARSMSYTLALHGHKLGGATASINAVPAERAQAVKAFVDEIAGWVVEGRILLDAGRGVSESELAPLRADDLRDDILFSRYADMDFQSYLRGASAAFAVAAASAAVAGAAEPGGAGAAEPGGTGAAVAIEGFNTSGLAAALELEKLGFKITAVSTLTGCVSDPAGLDVSALADGYRSHGEDLLAHLGRQIQPPESIFETDCDSLLSGSKFGVVDHHSAKLIRAKVLGSLQHLAFTTRGLVALQRKGVCVLPDFLCLGGPLYAGDAEDHGAHQDIVRQNILTAAQQKTAALVQELAAHPEGMFLAACYRAEEFLLSWRDELPFGRPLAP